MSFSDIFIRRLEDGKLVEGWDQADMMGLMQQLGVIPPMGENGWTDPGFVDIQIRW